MSLKESAYFMKKIVKCRMPKLHIDIERWKYCMALDIYVSNLGRFKDTQGHLLTVCKKDGYLYCKGKLAHRLVLQTWKPVPNYANLTVDHKNHNTWDNRLRNLEWVTLEENRKRDEIDKKNNAPISTTINSTMNVDTMVMLNTTLMPIGNAKEILKNDKTISGNANIQRAFEKAMNTPNKPIKFGGYSITCIKKDNDK